MNTTPELLANAMANLDEQAIVSYAQQMLGEGYTISDIQASMKRVGDYFEQGEYFIADLICTTSEKTWSSHRSSPTAIRSRISASTFQRQNSSKLSAP